MLLQSFKPNTLALIKLRELLYTLGPQPNQYRYGDHQIIRQIEGLIQVGRLCLCRENAGGDQAEADSPVGPILRQLPALTRHFQFERKTLRLIDIIQWRNIRFDSQYEVVPSEQARKILIALAGERRNASTDSKTLLQAADFIPDTRRLNLEETGVLLLSYTPLNYSKDSETDSGPPSAKKSPSTPASPALRAPPKPTHWVEIKLSDTNNQPVSGAKYRIELPNKSIVEGVLDASGTAWLGNLPSGGNCKITFPDIDAQEWN